MTRFHFKEGIMFAGEREELKEGREHLTVSGRFQSDKYPWAAAGYLPLSITDPLARDLLETYARRREHIDPEFTRDLLEALKLTPEKESKEAKAKATTAADLTDDSGKYYYSDCEEEWGEPAAFDTRKEAIEAGFKALGEQLKLDGGPLYTGQSREKTEDEADNGWDYMMVNVKEHEYPRKDRPAKDKSGT